MLSARCFSDREIAEIVGRASNLTERLTGQLVPTGADPAAAAPLLERWKHLATVHDPAGFRRLLGGFGLADAPDAHLLGLLGEVRPAPGFPLPPWAEFLQEMTSALAAAFPAGDDAPKLPAAARSIPFAGLYAPVVALAWRKVAARAPGMSAWMDPAAGQGLGCHLLQRLSEVCSLTLQTKFLAFRAVRESGMAHALFGERPPARVSLYRAFVDAQGTGGMRDFFLEYPVAARLAAQLALAWIDFSAEFLHRLEVDAPALADRFFDGHSPGRVSVVQAGISDPHHGGRSVLIVHFAAGRRIVYKPRPMHVDAAFFKLLRWLNAHGQRPALPTLDMLTRDRYGWESFAGWSACPNRRAARQWYRRAGALLYHLQAARGTDFHCENIIATAGGPVPVDLEALCHPPGGVEDGDGSLDDPLLRTGMLPLLEPGPDGGRPISYSALDAPTHQRSAAAGVRWRKVNSDAMEVDEGRSRHFQDAHRPRLHGKLLSARGHLEELVDGFKRAARLVRRDPALTREYRARLARLHALPTRFVKRPTRVYLTLLRHTLQPRCLRSGSDRSIEWHLLPATAGSEAEHATEAASLETLDVPYLLKPPEAGPAAVAPEALSRQIAVIREAVRRRLVLERGCVRPASLARERRVGAANQRLDDLVETRVGRPHAGQ